MPTRQLTLSEWADVIAFMLSSVPRSRTTFYKNLDGGPSIECGLRTILIAIEEALRNARAPRNSKKTD